MMKGFEEFLAEGRDAPLYHGTDVKSVMSMLKSGFIIGDYTDHPHPTISVSRSLNYAKWIARDKWNVSYHDLVVLELNQAKIVQNYKIKPFNAWDTEGTRNMRGEKLHDTFALKNEYEEVIFAKKLAFDDYVTKIILFMKPGLPINPLLQHRKLYHKGKFVN